MNGIQTKIGLLDGCEYDCKFDYDCYLLFLCIDFEFIIWKPVLVLRL